MSSFETPGPKPPSTRAASALPDGEVRLASAGDLKAVKKLLYAEGLPEDGVAEALENFFVFESGGTVRGAAGVELYGAEGLLRSTAVAAGFRGRGIARALVDRVIAHAGGHGCHELYLLTENADGFFRRCGFAAVSRDEAPEAIRGSKEFTTLCPATAVLMRRRVAG